MAKSNIRETWSIMDLFIKKNLKKWRQSLPLELRQADLQQMDAVDLDNMIGNSNHSAEQFALMTAMFAEAQAAVLELDAQLDESIAKEKTCEPSMKASVQAESELISISLTKAQARITQLQAKIDMADNLDDKGKAMIYDRAAEMRDNLFNDKMDLIQDNLNNIQAAMNDAMRRSIQVLNTGKDHSGERAELHNEVVGETAFVENDSEILATLLDAQEKTRKSQRTAISGDAAALLAKRRGETK